MLAGSLVSLPNTTGPMHDAVRVHFIDVGQGDAIYIQMPDNNDILIDAGDSEHGEDVVRYLQAQGMDDEIELLIATHPHEDHIGGLPEVMAAFQVRELIDCGLTIDTECYETYKQAVEAEQCHRVSDDHQCLDFNGIILQILTGNEVWNEVNNYSVVARLDIGEVEFLFAGDAEEAAEANLTGEVSAEILKIAHHGGDSSSSFDFLSQVKPHVAVISVGVANRYGHPDAETLSKIKDAGADIYRTDLNGDITVTTDGKTYSVIGEK